MQPLSNRIFWHTFRKKISHLFHCMGFLVTMARKVVKQVHCQVVVHTCACVPPPAAPPMDPPMADKHSPFKEHLLLRNVSKLFRY